MITEKESYELFQMIWKARLQSGKNENKYKQQLKDMVINSIMKNQTEAYYTDKKGNRRLMVMMFPFLML